MVMLTGQKDAKLEIISTSPAPLYKVQIDVIAIFMGENHHHIVSVNGLQGQCCVTGWHREMHLHV